MMIGQGDQAEGSWGYEERLVIGRLQTGFLLFNIRSSLFLVLKCKPRKHSNDDSLEQK